MSAAGRLCPELANAPVLMFGLSGTPEAAGLGSRVPQRVIGVIERVPDAVLSLTDPAALAVPTLVMLSELDALVDNSTTEATVAANRARGGLWALSIEPGVQHAQATDVGNSLNVAWIAAALAVRLPAVPGDPLVAPDETSGWLGDLSTNAIIAWAGYTGNPTTAAWLPNQSAAQAWHAVVTSGGGGGGAPRPAGPGTATKR